MSSAWLSAISEAQRGLHVSAVDAMRTLAGGGIDALPSLTLAAFAFGMLHALLPGHGKATLASYYAAEGNWRGALSSTLLLIATHVGLAIVLVLSGFAILEHALASAGRSPALELASQILIILIGALLLWNAFHRSHSHGSFAPLLAIAAGLVPCPLTTFIMTYAAVHGAIKWGLLLSAFFALGMIVTVALFPLSAVLARIRFVPLIAQTEAVRSRIEFGLEAFAAIALIMLGAWPLLIGL